jgi:hypothetical protein
MDFYPNVAATHSDRQTFRELELECPHIGSNCVRFLPPNRQGVHEVKNLAEALQTEPVTYTLSVDRAVKMKIPVEM